MGLQLSQIKAQTNLMNAESAKAYAEANKIKGVDTEAAKQGISTIRAMVRIFGMFRIRPVVIATANLALASLHRVIFKRIFDCSILASLYTKCTDVSTIKPS